VGFVLLPLSFLDMGTLSKSVLSTDLDFMIHETGKDFTGVTPAAITDKVFNGSLNTMQDSYDVMLNGNEVTIDAEIMLNGKA
jgi:hypothetical protein